MKGTILGVILATLAACGAGIGFAYQVVLQAPASSPQPHPGVPIVSSQFRIKGVGPILTNLKEPPTTYVRMETSVLLDADEDPANALTSRLADDFLSYMRTVTLTQLQGASGFQLLKDDLIERARLRSNGKVRDLFIQTLVVE